jgi:hypothetical protein
MLVTENLDKSYMKGFYSMQKILKRPTDCYALTDTLVNDEDDEVESGVSHKIFNSKICQTVQVTG